MKANEVRAMSIPEARKQLHELKTELAKEKAVAAGGTRPENPGKIGSLKRNVARILTIINEKKRAGEVEEIPVVKQEKKAEEAKPVKAEEKQVKAEKATAKKHVKKVVKKKAVKKPAKKKTRSKKEVKKR